MTLDILEYALHSAIDTAVAKAATAQGPQTLAAVQARHPHVLKTAAAHGADAPQWYIGKCPAKGCKHRTHIDSRELGRADARGRGPDGKPRWVDMTTGQPYDKERPGWYNGVAPWAQCPEHGKLYRLQLVKGSYREDIKCTSRCWNATGPSCDCSCGGANHGAGAPMKHRHDHLDVAKGFFDNGQVGLDPLLWTSENELRPDARDRIVQWWRHAFTRDAPLWSRLYVSGSATSHAWARRAPGDVDVQIVVDYPALRKHHPEYATMNDPELHVALVTQLKASLAGVEAAPGLPLEGFIRPEQSVSEYEQHVHRLGQGVWDIQAHQWIVQPPPPVDGEDIDTGEILEGEGGQLALEYPEWLAQARQLVAVLDSQLANDAGEHLQQIYTLLHHLREQAFSPTGQGARDVGNFLWRYAMDHGPLARVKHILTVTPLEKIWPAYQYTTLTVLKTQPAHAGTERWITVHPHGEGEGGGIPVLIREMGDGTARVIGGAGGHLDHLVISGKGRTQGAETRPRTVATQGRVVMSRDERAQHEAAAEKAYQQNALSPRAMRPLGPARA